MMKRTLQTLGWILLAAPLLVVGCSDSSDKGGGTGGSGPVKWDGGGGTGGSLDGAAGPEVQVPPADTGVLIDGAPADAPVGPDSLVLLDGAVADAAAPDAPIVDTRPPTVDGPGTEVQAIDTTPAVDVTVPEVCKETTKWTGGNITGSRTMTKACSPYTIKSTTNVEKDGTLTIEPGVTLKFDPHTELYIYGGAILNAVGTAADPIVLTSSKSVPAVGDWVGVQVQNGGNSVTLKYVTVEYAGYSDNAAVDITSASADIENCSIHDNAGIGLDATGSLKGTKVLASTFYSNGDLPLVIGDGVQADATNTFKSGALVNTRQFVSFAGNISSTRTLDITEVPYLFESGLSIEKNANVTVNPGVTLSLSSGKELYIYAGATFNAVGTATSPVVFTSSKAVPAKGDWTGLDFQNDASSITIKYATIQYAGYGDSYAVNATNATWDIENCTIQHNLNGGVDGTDSKHCTLKNNTFSDNNADGTTVFNWTMEGATNATVSGNAP
jgi:parallel beta-helix repeat protein